MALNLKTVSDEDLREAIKSFKNTTWDEDAILRKLTIQMYGEGTDDVMHMLSMAVPLSIELEYRTRKK